MQFDWRHGGNCSGSTLRGRHRRRHRHSRLLSAAGGFGGFCNGRVSWNQRVSGWNGAGVFNTSVKRRLVWKVQILPKCLEWIKNRQKYKTRDKWFPRFWRFEDSKQILIVEIHDPRIWMNGFPNKGDVSQIISTLVVWDSKFAVLRP